MNLELRWQAVAQPPLVEQLAVVLPRNYRLVSDITVERDMVETDISAKRSSSNSSLPAIIGSVKMKLSFLEMMRSRKESRRF
jgi:hypothetical protein